jgi:hypothetical protein
LLVSYLLALPASAISIKQRIASEREGLSFCWQAQFSIADQMPAEA